MNRSFQDDVAARLILGHLGHLKRIEQAIDDSSEKVQTAVAIGTGWRPTNPLGMTVRGITVHTYDHVKLASSVAIDVSVAATGRQRSMVNYHAMGDSANSRLPDNSIDF